MTTERLLALLQFTDGLFPAGGFAHSFGLETYVQAGTVRDREGLEAFISAHLEGSSGPADAVAAALAARADRDLTAIVDLDARLDAMKLVPEFRAASVQMGRQTLRVASALGANAFVAALARAVETEESHGHHAVIFGAVTGDAGLDPQSVAAGFLHSTATLLINAGLRLLAIGQRDGQLTLARLRPLIVRLAAEAAALGPDDLWSFTPALDIAGIRHARLEARLFRS
jgi:urease accessory protein